VGDVGEDADRLAHRELALAGELGPERFALHERHRVVEQVPGGRGGEQGNDVRVLEGGGEFDLAPEALDVDAGGHLGRQHLDDDWALQRGSLREKHAAHPATAELPLEAIRVAEGGLQASQKVAHGSLREAGDYARASVQRGAVRPQSRACGRLMRRLPSGQHSGKALDNPRRGPGLEAPPPPAHGCIRSVRPYRSVLKRRNPSLVPLTHAASTPTANLPNRQRTPPAIRRTAGHVIRKPSPAPEVLRVGPQQSYAKDWRKVALLTASSSDACALSDETATSRTAGIARTFLIPHHIPTPSPATSQPNYRAGVIVRLRYSTGP